MLELIKCFIIIYGACYSWAADQLQLSLVRLKID